MTSLALVVFSLSLAAQILAVYLALRTLVSSRVRWAWGAIAIALVLLLPHRAITAFTVFHHSRPAAFIPAESVSLLVSILFCLGLVRLRRYFRQSELDAELRRLTMPEVGTEAMLRAVGKQQRANTSPPGEENAWQFFDTIDDFLFVLDEESRILKVNRTATERLGYSEAELLGRLSLTLYPKERWAEALALTVELVSGTLEYSPIPLEAKDGTMIPVETRMVAGKWSGRPVFFSVCKDIFGLKLSEEKFSKAFHGSPALMALIKKSNRSVFDVNEAFLQVLGYSRDEAIGKTPSELNLFVDLVQRDRILNALEQGGKIRNIEIQLRARQGEVRDGLVSAETLSLARESLILIVVVDITERKRVEEALRLTAQELAQKNQELGIARDAALEADRAKSQFLANMSHEIRTPLNGMLGLAELLSRSPLNSDQQEYVDSIARCGDLLLGILNDILDFSKIEAGHLQLESISFDLAALVYDVVELYGPKASTSALELVADLDAHLPPRLLGDPGRLRQVLGNLMSNAVKFTSQGHILIEVKQVSGPDSRVDGKAVVTIAVCDTGEGIPPQVFDRLFQPFSQADASTSRKHGGTGLGLALSRRIVEGMGGQIDLQSQEGKGSTVTVTLALAVDPVGAEEAAPPSILCGTRCLVVDDSALVRTSMEKQLRCFDMVVEVAASAAQALHMIHSALAAGVPYDLTLIDVGLDVVKGGKASAPGPGNERLCQTLRNHPGLASLGIVMIAPLATRGSVSDVPLLSALSCDGYIAKPSRNAVLAKVLASVLERRRDGASGSLVTRHTVSPGRPPHARGDRLSSSLRVLLAEDNEINQLVARKMLEELGANVTLAIDGHQVLQAVEKEKFDVVLMDCQMPRMDGFMATARIRTMEQQRGGRLPIVAMTANALVGDDETCLAAGMDGYLSKPFTRQGLLDALLRFTDARTDALAVPAGQVASPTTAASVHLILDKARFQQMDALFSSSSGNNFTMLLLSFQSNSAKRIEELRRAAERKDADAIAAVAHAIKGSSGNLGFVGMERIAEMLVRSAKLGRHEEFSTLLASLEDESQKVDAFLKSHLAKPPGGA